MLYDKKAPMGNIFLEGASLHRLMGNFPDVHVQLDLVTAMVDFGPRTCRRSPKYPPPWNACRKGCDSGFGLPKLPTFWETVTLRTSMLSDKLAAKSGVKKKIYCLAASPLRRLNGNFPTVHLRPKSVTEMVDFSARTFWRRPLYPPPPYSRPPSHTHPHWNPCQKGCDMGSELSEFPTFWKISTRRTPMLSATLVSREEYIVWRGRLSVE